MVYGKRKVLSFTIKTEQRKLKTHMEKCFKIPPKKQTKEKVETNSNIKTFW